MSKTLQMCETRETVHCRALKKVYLIEFLLTQPNFNGASVPILQAMCRSDHVPVVAQ